MTVLVKGLTQNTPDTLVKKAPLKDLEMETESTMLTSQME